MGFESGAVSFRVFHLPRKMPDDALERFAEHAIPPVESVSHGEVRGWASGRHLLERTISEDTSIHGGYLNLNLVTAERKIPTSLLRAECRMEELAHMAANGTDYVNRSSKSEIRRMVEERLLPQMPPQLKGIPVLHDRSSQRLYAGALSVGHVDTFLAYFQHTLGYSAIPMLPEAVALQRKGSDTRNWRPASFSPDVSAELVSNEAGHDFLTWLWFCAEKRGGIVRLEDAGETAFMLEGPLTFMMEGDGAFETVLRKGQPLLSAEAKTCLLSGKKLKNAKVILAQGDLSWQVTLDAGEFIFRSLKLPDVEALDAISRFQERVRMMDLFVDSFFGLFDRFVEERQSEKQWRTCQSEMQAWAKERKTRR